VIDGVVMDSQRQLHCVGGDGVGSGDDSQNVKLTAMAFYGTLPHAWLFRRIASGGLVMHHGGAGTVGAAARFGIPQVMTRR
jgi:UDP:flavonoid glycosyltransferase YjiC (YdhE family)